MLKCCVRAAGALLALTCFAAVSAHAALPAPMDRIVRGNNLPESAVSVLVQEVGARQPVLALNIDTPRNPASTIKLMTTFVALDVLGPTHRFRTEAYALGPITGGVLDGDLLLKGYGDPYLVEEEMWKFAGELHRRGLQRINGQLLIDDSYYAPHGRDAGSFDGQPLRLYNVQPNALMVNFKAFTFTFAPRADGDGVLIKSNPSLPNLQIINQIKLERGKCRGVLVAVKMSIPDLANPDQVAFSGNYPAGCGEQSLPRTAMRPETYAYGIFKSVWAHWGGTIEGNVSRGVMPAGQRPFAVWYSPPLAEVIRPLNKWSNNVMADALLYALASESFPPPLKPELGAAVVKAYLSKAQVPADGLVIENGSGLSRVTRISARTMGGLLLHAYRSPYMPEYLASLSLSGLDGTMRNRFRHAPESGRMHLKTGHLNDVAAVAGYVLAATGKTYVVTLLVNHPTANHGGGSQLINALLAWTYQLR